MEENIAIMNRFITVLCCSYDACKVSVFEIRLIIIFYFVFCYYLNIENDKSFFKQIRKRLHDKNYWISMRFALTMMLIVYSSNILHCILRTSLQVRYSQNCWHPHSKNLFMYCGKLGTSYPPLSIWPWTLKNDLKCTFNDFD